MTLPDADRFRLLGGPYRPPRCKIGGWLTCRRRGRVRVHAMSEALIPWPMTRPRHGGNPSIILCGDLVKAVRQESTKAIQRHWGVKSHIAWTWRKILGVDQNNAGTRELRSKWWREGGVGGAAEGPRLASLSSPERAAKIAAAKLGKPRPKKVIAAMRRGFRKWLAEQ